MNKKSLIIGIFTIIILLVLSTTAVPQAQSKTVLESLEEKNKIDVLSEPVKSGILDGLIDLLQNIVNFLNKIAKAVETLTNLALLINTIITIVEKIASFIENIQYIISFIQTTWANITEGWDWLIDRFQEFNIFLNNLIGLIKEILILFGLLEE